MLEENMNQRVTIHCLGLLHRLTNLKELKTLHAHMIKTTIDQYPFQISKLLEFAALSSLPGCFSYARELFSQIKNPNLFLYNTMIRGSLLSHRADQAIQLYIEMRGKSLLPNEFTFPFLLRSCEQQSDLKIGEEVHGCIFKMGFVSNLYVLTTLLNLYSVCAASMRAATQVFEEMPVKDVVAWNSMISGHLRHGDIDSAKSCFAYTNDKSIVTWNTLIAGYASSGKIEEAERLFREMPLKDTTTWNSMISGYIRMGDMISAEGLFERMLKRDVVSWTIMIDGYVKNGSYDLCLSFFHKMQLAKIRPTEVTLLSILTACGNLGALELGRWVHCYINRNGFIVDNNLGSVLIDMYGKYGDMEKGLEVFYSIDGKRDLITWTSVITGLAINGGCRKALEFFSWMVCEGTKPDEITFLGILSACSHGGFIIEGFQYFNSMIVDYHLVPRVEHYSCMVDLLGRSGLMEEAEELVKGMPIKPDAIIWGSLFGACQVHKNAELGERVMEHLIKLDPENKENYVTLSNIYAATGRWSNVVEARKNLKERRIRRTPGCSSIEVNYQVHEFVSRDSSHLKTKEIFKMLELLDGGLREETIYQTTSSLEKRNISKVGKFLMETGEVEQKEISV